MRNNNNNLIVNDTQDHLNEDNQFQNEMNEAINHLNEDNRIISENEIHETLIDPNRNNRIVTENENIIRETQNNSQAVQTTAIIPYNQGNHEDEEHNSNLTCSICNIYSIYPAIILPCSHTGFCRRCLSKIFLTYLRCPYCRQQVTTLQRFIILT